MFDGIKLEALYCLHSLQLFFVLFKGVKESLKTACEGKANVSKAFIDTVLLQQLAPVILNEVRYCTEITGDAALVNLYRLMCFLYFYSSEKNLNLSTIVVDTLMDEVISQLEQQQAKLVR